eukprot:scaffold11105_cov75-Phaeocystis_antarctica.AAC.1
MRRRPPYMRHWQGRDPPCAPDPLSCFPAILGQSRAAVCHPRATRRPRLLRRRRHRPHLLRPRPPRGDLGDPERDTPQRRHYLPETQ